MKKLFLLGLLVLIMVFGITVAGCNGSENEEETICIVTFDTDGGIPKNIPPIEVVKGESMGKSYPTNPTKAGFNFAGWYDGKKYSSGTPVEKDINLKAKWELPPLSKVDKIFEFLETKEEDGFPLPEGYDVKSDGVTLGTITEKTYHSTTTGVDRKCNVYTPPGYDENETYPILYLLHGIGGDHTEWVTGTPYYADAGVPKLNAIVSNLIILEKVPPMIIVMPNVRARQQDSDLANNPTNVAAFYNFINDLRDDLMPFIEENYNISDKREDRAIAGLSFGGVESLYISLNMPETFGHLGVFSSPNFLFQHAHPDGKGTEPFTTADATYPEEYRDDTFILICCGTQDNTGITACRNYSKVFTDNGIRNFFYEVDGQHHFDFWNHALYYFVQCIFWAE